MEIKQYLKNLNIGFKTYSHPPLYTCEQAEKYNKEIKGIHSKNLFLKSKKSPNFYLIILPSSEKLNLKEFESLLNEKLTFANEKELKDILNLSAGAVSPFGLINDKENFAILQNSQESPLKIHSDKDKKMNYSKSSKENKTTLIIKKDIWNSDFVSFHPNINTETLELTGKDFQKYIGSLKNKMIIN